VKAPFNEAGTLFHYPLFSKRLKAAFLKFAVEDASFFPMILIFPQS
jgi:hypothetical protein